MDFTVLSEVVQETIDRGNPNLWILLRHSLIQFLCVKERMKRSDLSFNELLLFGCS